jgi:hypothetical protein
MRLISLYKFAVSIYDCPYAGSRPACHHQGPFASACLIEAAVALCCEGNASSIAVVQVGERRGIRLLCGVRTFSSLQRISLSLRRVMISLDPRSLVV